MKVTIHLPGERPRTAPGPRDLGTLGPGSTIVVTDSHDRERDFGRWAGALGSAALRGARVIRT